MKSVRIHEFGGPETLVCEDLPEPRPEPGQVLVRIEAAGVNFLDIYQRRGEKARSIRSRKRSRKPS